MLEVQRVTNPYAIKSASIAAAAEATQTDPAVETLANSGSATVPYSTGTYSQLAEAYQDCKVLASERVNFSNTNPGYIVLRRWGLDQWAIHYYSVVNDSFEFGQYLKDYPEARKAYKARIEKYHK